MNPGGTKHVCNLRLRSIISKFEKALINIYDNKTEVQYNPDGIFVFLMGSILNILTSLLFYSTLYNNYTSKILHQNINMANTMFVPSYVLLQDDSVIKLTLCLYLCFIAS